MKLSAVLNLPLRMLLGILPGILPGILLFSSCGEIREEITINKDGSGKYVVSSDMIPMMRGVMEEFAKMGLSGDSELDSAEIEKKVEDMIWKDFPGEIDSIINFDHKIPEDMKEDKEKMVLLKKVTMFMRGGRSKGYLKTGLEYNFENSQDFQRFTDLLEEGAQQDEKGSLLGQSKTITKITPKSFSRVSKPAGTANDSISTAITSILQEMYIITTLNFSKTIKQVDVTTYDIVEQTDKSITLKYNAIDALKSGLTREINIKLK